MPTSATPEHIAALVRMNLSSEDLFGKCDSTLEFRLPNDLKDALRRHAAKNRMPMGACLRLMIATSVFGQAHVASVLGERLLGVGSPVRTSEPTEVES